MFRRHEIDTNETPGMRYLYWGLTGARFGRSSKDRAGGEPERPAHWSQPGLAQRLWTGRPDEVVAEPEPDAEAEAHVEKPRGQSLEQTVARLTAERDSARSERELEADYREALLRDVEMLRAQLEDAQRRIREVQCAQPRVAPAPGDQTERERALEQELSEARQRISELEAQRAIPSMSALPAAPGGDEMMDIFLQFVGTQERRPDAQT